MLTYQLDEKNKYYSLYYNIREDILHGVLSAGERLPGKRTLAEHLAVSVITVQTAYEQLLAEGYITSEERRGYFVAEVNVGESADATPPHSIEPPKKEYDLDLTTGRAPAELFPFSVWASLMRKTLSEEGEHLLERVPCDGSPRLKAAIAAYLFRFRGFKVDPRYIVVGAGAEYLYGVIVQLLGRDKPYAVENPGYGRVPNTYRLNGASCTFIDVEEKGVNIEEVERSGACALHISPAHQYPTGAVIPVSNRSRLISWAQNNNAYIIEDDYDSEFRLWGKPLQTMAAMNGERVIYLNTFSKTLAPSMRMGYMVLPPHLYNVYLQLYSQTANVVPLFEQLTLAAMLDGGYFERHVNRLKNYYKGIRGELVSLIDSLPFDKRIIETGGGLHLTLQLPDFASDGEIKARAEEYAINVKCLSDYLFTHTQKYRGVAVINYSSVTQERLERIKKRLNGEYN
ncbi:MAG: PLP-dependent aminotransferase family protein [Candidatus Coproplasma sp.]